MSERRARARGRGVEHEFVVGACQVGRSRHALGMEAFVAACSTARSRRDGKLVRVEVGPDLAEALGLADVIEVDGETVPVVVRPKQHLDVGAVAVVDERGPVLEAFYFAAGVGRENQVLYHVLRCDGVSDDDARAAIEAVG